MTTVTYTVPAISCGHCTHPIETELNELQGIQSVKADEATKKVVITFAAPADEAKIKALLAEGAVPSLPSLPSVQIFRAWSHSLWSDFY